MVSSGPGQQHEVAGDLVLRDESVRLRRLAERQGVVEARLDAAGLDLLETPPQITSVTRHRAADLLLRKEHAANVEAHLGASREAKGHDGAERSCGLDAPVLRRPE